MNAPSAPAASDGELGLPGNACSSGRRFGPNWVDLRRWQDGEPARIAQINCRLRLHEQQVSFALPKRPAA